jgi:hypothetical protein
LGDFTSLEQCLKNEVFEGAAELSKIRVKLTISWVEELSSITKTSVLGGWTFWLNLQKAKRLLFHLKPFLALGIVIFVISI